MEDAISTSVAQPRFRTVLIGVFGGVALLLAAIGIYGVVAYSVAQRLHEFGIRMALGAQRRDVLALIAAQQCSALTGMAAGALGSLALMRVLSSLLFRAGTKDPLTFAAVAIVLTGVALLASTLPARRATRIDPVIALREE